MDTVHRLTDTAEGGWLRPRLLEWRHAPGGVPVGAVVPTGFEAVVRVLHPAGDDGRRWSEVAAEVGRIVHPLAQWHCIADHDTSVGRGEADPEEGSLPPQTLGAILQHCAADGDVFHAVWDGFGFWRDPRPDLTTLVRGRGRAYLLFEGPKAPVMRWPSADASCSQSANLIWPRDRSWCIATEIDWDSTLVAGSAATCGALLGDGRLEVFEVDYGCDLSWLGDTVNPRPDWLTPGPG